MTLCRNSVDHREAVVPNQEGEHERFLCLGNHLYFFAPNRKSSSIVQDTTDGKRTVLVRMATCMEGESSEELISEEAPSNALSPLRLFFGKDRKSQSDQVLEWKARCNRLPNDDQRFEEESNDATREITYRVYSGFVNSSSEPVMKTEWKVQTNIPAGVSIKEWLNIYGQRQLYEYHWLEWKRFDNIWIPTKTAEYYYDYVNDGNQKQIKHHCEYEFKRIVVNQPISEEIFSMEYLGLTDGDYIQDMTSGLIFPYQ